MTLGRWVLGFALGAACAAAPLGLVAQEQSRVIGNWLGTLSLPGATLRLGFEVSEAADGLTTTMRSIDQGNAEIPVATTVLEADSVTFSIPAIAGEFKGTLGPSADTISGTWSQGGTSIPLTLARTDVMPTVRRPQEPQGPLPYEALEVEFSNMEEGHSLAGTLTLPPGDGPFPAAVLISGSGPQDRDEALLGHRPFLVLADHLTRAGIAVLRFDDRGVGGSGGTFETATSDDFAGDVRGAVRYLAEREEIDITEIGLIGHSEGGLIAPMVAAESDQVAFIVLLAGPGVDGETILLSQGEAIGRADGLDEEGLRRNQETSRNIYAILRNTPDTTRAAVLLEPLIRETFDLMPAQARTEAGLDASGALEQAVQSSLTMLNSAWFRRFLEYDPRPTLERVQVPVLAIVGEKDLQVLAEPNSEAIRAALRAGGNPDFEVRILPGLNHLFQTATTGAPSEYGDIEETFAPAALEAVSNWILERTR